MGWHLGWQWRHPLRWQLHLERRAPCRNRRHLHRCGSPGPSAGHAGAGPRTHQPGQHRRGARYHVDRQWHIEQRRQPHAIAWPGRRHAQHRRGGEQHRQHRANGRGEHRVERRYQQQRRRAVQPAGRQRADQWACRHLGRRAPVRQHTQPGHQRPGQRCHELARQHGAKEWRRRHPHTGAGWLGQPQHCQHLAQHRQRCAGGRAGQRHPEQGLSCHQWPDGAWRLHPGEWRHRWGLCGGGAGRPAVQDQHADFGDQGPPVDRSRQPGLGARGCAESRRPLVVGGRHAGSLAGCVAARAADARSHRLPGRGQHRPDRCGRHPGTGGQHPPQRHRPPACAGQPAGRRARGHRANGGGRRGR